MNLAMRKLIGPVLGSKTIYYQSRGAEEYFVQASMIARPFVPKSIVRIITMGVN